MTIYRGIVDLVTTDEIYVAISDLGGAVFGPMEILVDDTSVYPTYSVGDRVLVGQVSAIKEDMQILGKSKRYSPSSGSGLPIPTPDNAVLTAVGGAWVASLDANLDHGAFNDLLVNNDLTVDGSATISGTLGVTNGITTVGTATSGLARQTATTTLTLASTGHPWQNGLSTGLNLAADRTQFQARNNGAAAPLGLNLLGGDVTIGLGTASVNVPGYLRAPQTTAMSLATTTHPFQIGTTTAANLVMDKAQIQGRFNGAKSSVAINPLGGNVALGDSTSVVSSAGSASFALGATTNAALYTPTLPGDLITKAFYESGTVPTQTSFSTAGPATWTKPANLRGVRVRLVGGGGAGGGAAVTAAGQASGGSGGGAGGYAEMWIAASALGATESLVIGAGGVGVLGTTGGNGGATNFGAWCSANGGGGGFSSAAGTGNSTPTPGPGGTASTGGLGISISGDPGFRSLLIPSLVSLSGAGGGSMLSPVSSQSLSGATGAGGGAYGGGGSGAIHQGVVATAHAGGDGFRGVIIVEEFYY